MSKHLLSLRDAKQVTRHQSQLRAAIASPLPDSDTRFHVAPTKKWADCGPSLAARNGTWKPTTRAVFVFECTNSSSTRSGLLSDERIVLSQVQRTKNYVREPEAVVQASAATVT